MVMLSILYVSDVLLRQAYIIMLLVVDLEHCYVMEDIL